MREREREREKGTELSIDPSYVGRSPILQQKPYDALCTLSELCESFLHAPIRMHAAFTVGHPLFASELSATLSPLKALHICIINDMRRGNRTGCVCVQARERETEKERQRERDREKANV